MGPGGHRLVWGLPLSGRVRQRKGEREEGGTTLYDEQGRRLLHIVYTKMSADEDDYDLRIDVAKESRLPARLPPTGQGCDRCKLVQGSTAYTHSPFVPPLPSFFYLLAPPSLLPSRLELL